MNAPRQPLQELAHVLRLAPHRHTHGAHPERRPLGLSAPDRGQVRRDLRYGVVEDSRPAVAVGEELGKGVTPSVASVVSVAAFSAGSTRWTKKIGIHIHDRRHQREELIGQQLAEPVLGLIGGNRHCAHQVLAAHRNHRCQIDGFSS